MHRIDTPTAQKDKFGQGKNGFTRGNPQTGTLATKMDSLYFDAIQEEIANVIESVGITLNKEKHDQLKLAIQQYVKNGQIKLNSATNSESETEAATPLAVKLAYDLAGQAKWDANIDASTTKKGRVKLSSATNSESETEAATSLAVKLAYDLAGQAKWDVEHAVPNSRKINGKQLNADITLNAADVCAVPAQKINDNDYLIHSNLNFELRPKVNNSHVVTIDQFADYKNPTIGWYSLPSGYIHQFGTVFLPKVGEYNVVTISGIKYYTQVYKVLLPRSYPVAQVATTVTLVGSPLNGKQENEFGVWARNNRGSDGIDFGVSKSSFDVSITSTILGYTPVIHFSSDGY